MSRRHRAEKRKILPDVKYNSVMLSKFINCVMLQGKKSVSEGIVYGALDIIEKKHKRDPFESFKEAIANIKPNLEVISVRVGGANYQVPSVVSENRGSTLALRWLLDAAKKRSEKTMIEKLAEEIFEAVNGRGSAVKKKEDTHKMAEANKAFSHFSPKKGG